MKPTHIILTRCDDQDMLTVNGPPFLCIAAERFVVVDKRTAARVRIEGPKDPGPVEVPPIMGETP